MPHAQLDGRRLFYDEAGEGEPLLLVQGMSGTRLSWGDPFLAALHEAGFATVAYDHRGVGRSDPIDLAAPLTIADLAEDAGALLDALGLESVHVLGISMGGMVAQELALGHPDRLRTLALGCTYPGGPGAQLTARDDAQRLFGAMGSGDRELALRAMWEINVSPGFAAEGGRFDVFRAMATSAPVAVPVIVLQSQAVVAHDASARLADIAAPTLVVHGTVDRMLPVANAELLAAAIPGARLELLEDVGHLFWWEQPERSAALVRDHALRSAGRTS
jgi:3-oxoadipate enol-lactonase